LANPGVEAIEETVDLPRYPQVRVYVSESANQRYEGFAQFSDDPHDHWWGPHFRSGASRGGQTPREPSLCAEAALLATSRPSEGTQTTPMA
jgi:hypothetical protein